MAEQEFGESKKKIVIKCHNGREIGYCIERHCALNNNKNNNNSNNNK